MSVLVGNSGNVVLTGSFAAVIINVYEWRLEWESDEYDSTAFSAAATHHHTYSAGMYEGRGTLRAFCDDTAALTIAELDANGAASTFVFKVREVGVTDADYQGSLHITNWSTGANKQFGMNEITADFETTGAITANMA